MYAVVYNDAGVTAVSRFDDVVREIESLTLEEQKKLLKILVRKIAIPLQDPESFFDDWNDPKVDEAYADCW